MKSKQSVFKSRRPLNGARSHRSRIENPLVGVVASIIVAVAAEYNYSSKRTAAAIATAAANCSSDYVEF